jgi:hypothetical protein
VTGDSSPTARSATLQANEYLTKPYDIEALLEAVTRLIGA